MPKTRRFPPVEDEARVNRIRRAVIRRDGRVWPLFWAVDDDEDH